MESPSTPSTEAGAARKGNVAGRRRPPSSYEQTRRVEWGKRFGAINAAYWRQVRTREAAQ